MWLFQQFVMRPMLIRNIEIPYSRITAERYQRAQQLLEDRRSALESVARQLLETETVDGAAVKQALADTVG